MIYYLPFVQVSSSSSLSSVLLLRHAQTSQTSPPLSILGFIDCFIDIWNVSLFQIFVNCAQQSCLWSASEFFTWPGTLGLTSLSPRGNFATVGYTQHLKISTNDEMSCLKFFDDNFFFSNSDRRCRKRKYRLQT